MTPNPLYRTQWRLLAAGFLALLTVFGLRNFFDFQRIKGEEMRRLESQTQMIEAAVGRQFGAVNHVLNGVRAELPRWRENPAHSGEALRYLSTVADAMLYVRTLIVLDAQGVSQFSNRTNLLGKSFAQRDYFQVAARQPQTGMLYITPPFTTSLGVHAMNLSRMLENPIGGFDGIVGATLDPTEFRLMLEAARYAADVELRLSHQSGTLFVAAPGGDGVTSADGRLVLERDLKLLDLTTSQTMRLHISRDFQQVLLPWYDRMQREAVFLLVLVVGCSLGLRFYQRRQQQYEALLATNAETLRASEQRQRALLGSMQDLVFFVDTSGHFVEYYAPVGRPDVFSAGTSVIGATITSVLPPAVTSKLDQAIAAATSQDRTQECEFSLDTPVGLRHLHCTLSPVKGGAASLIGFLGVVRDVTALTEAMQCIHTMAFHDVLTQLPNRRLLMDRLSQKLAGCARNPSHGALMFLDLDHFKALNDTHGHDAGDQLLVEVAQRLRLRMRANDTVARLGGDEFVVMLTALDADHALAAEQAMGIAEQVRNSLQQPYSLRLPDGAALVWECSSSIGVRVFGAADFRQQTDPSGIAETLLKAADSAMYAAKAAGRNMVRLAAGSVGV